ncbi:MAG: tol-pal system protein YbgF [Vicinamibacterales bacterium]
MSRRFLPGVLAFAWAIALASPAGAQSKREMQMMADIRMLQEQTQQLQQQLTAALAALGDNLKAISTRLEEQNTSSRKAMADQKLVVDQFGSDLRIVRERVDETNVRITSLSQEVEALRLAIPQYPPPSAPAEPMTALPNASGVQTPPADPPPSPVSPASPAMSPQRLYDTAWADFTAGQWSLCIQGFDTYLKSYSRTDAADDAQWYIGECQYSDGKFAEAIDAFNRVITNYPKGDRVPDAYYKRGLAFDRVGQPDRARESWETLLKQYPDSDLARLAKQNLDRLKK